jgi:hypothetical protein
MSSFARRGAAAAAAVVFALGGTALLTACSSGGSSDPSPTAEQTGAQVIGPEIVEPGQTEVTVTVGRIVVFNVADPMQEMISTDNEAVVAVTPGKNDGSAVFNPGAEALAPGTAIVTLTNMDTGAEQKVTITVTE